jgi:hypothetical protein
VLRIIVRQPGRLRVINAADPVLVDGFHAYEAAGGHRWTDDDALLPATLWAGFTGPLELMAAGQLHDALPRRWRRAPGRLSRQRGTCPARNVPSAEHTVSSAVIPQQPAQSPRLPPSQSPYAGREALAMPAAYT